MAVEWLWEYSMIGGTWRDDDDDDDARLLVAWERIRSEEKVESWEREPVPLGRNIGILGEGIMADTKIGRRWMRFEVVQSIESRRNNGWICFIVSLFHCFINMLDNMITRSFSAYPKI